LRNEALLRSAQKLPTTHPPRKNVQGILCGLFNEGEEISTFQAMYLLPNPKKGLPDILAFGEISPVGRRCLPGSK
jgi:hypothetical protein